MDLENLNKNHNIPTKKSSEIEVGEVSKTKENIISLPEITELEEPSKKIIQKILTRIEKGEYGLIIGDDASGRVPALILGGFIKRVSKLKNLHEPNIIFIPGKLQKDIDTTPERLKEHMAKYGLKVGDRVLIVTDAIESGRSLEVLSNLLKESGFGFDIATMGVVVSDGDVEESAYLEYSRKNKLADSNIISGELTRKENESNTQIPSIWLDRELNGVFKHPGDLKSRSVKLDTYPEFQEKVQMKINKSRLQVNILVDQLVDWYLAKIK